MADQDPEPPRLVRPYVAGQPSGPGRPARPAGHRRPGGGARTGPAAPADHAGAPVGAAEETRDAGGRRRRPVVVVMVAVVVALLAGLITTLLTRGDGDDGAGAPVAVPSALPLPPESGARSTAELSGPPASGPPPAVSSAAGASSVLRSSRTVPPRTSAVAPGGSTPAAAVNADGADLALGRPAAASSVEGAAYEPRFAVDGDPRTRWSSAFSDPQWISVDLGRLWLVSRVVLRWEAAYGVEYDLAVSADGTTWRTVWRTGEGAGGVQDVRFAAAPARFVRMTGTRRNGQYGYSLFELEVR
ncbi:discoidin domain-containing protein [Dactylosporangium aurantiacum]|uniref:Discoidin domain-containing protein n=1 Tax=Dactylosporangium aurantiacum TaxID=35754 RepID=A0A9Q9ICI5_9ACTN|nr:discoidin domain-containing protein [Dactylosporangium aurantiacum]MDG6103607.1 discoidin domain-containing protein [Dactylosporangium aurantiacum]UWZ51903.1 discoidin domain-containing protein [Dactylosporangium aurantiacum]